MANVFVEERNGSYVGLENHQVICRGTTQQECGETAHRIRPRAIIYGERVRNTSVGHPDKWRVLHHPSM